MPATHLRIVTITRTVGACGCGATSDADPPVGLTPALRDDMPSVKAWLTAHQATHTRTAPVHPLPTPAPTLAALPLAS